MVEQDVITGEDLDVFFINPSWGEYGSSPVKIGATRFDAEFSADYVNDQSFQKSRIKPQKKSGSIFLEDGVDIEL